MRRILSTKYSAGAFNFAMLVLRVGLGVLVASHGYDKLVHFNNVKHDFINFLGLGSTITLMLVVFAEFFCSIFLILGLFTRLAVLPILIVMTVALFKVQQGHLFAAGEKAAIYLACSLVILLCGPGKISVDGMIGK
ncbi:MAG: DoxX family protein [Bacteroidota bacterium]|nr:DoxX family protein [Bacteroidota bacterium]MDQ6890390.1 DoxX family protein [Bacteroidota bacterium]